MAAQETKQYMELQMDELKVALSDDVKENPSSPKKTTAFNEKNAAIAKLYEDAAEYEEDLACFEKELEIVKGNKFEDIVSSLNKEFPNEERDFAQEIRVIIEAGWSNLVEVEKTHPQEQLALIKEADLTNILNELNASYPDSNDDFEQTIRKFLTTRWDMLVSIKKEHIKEEHNELKIAGLKPKYVKRVYEQLHGKIG